LRARRSHAARLAGLADALLLHRLREILSALAQRIERASLRFHRTVGVALAERAFRLLHGFTGAAELIAFALVLAILTESVLAQLLQQLVELLAQRLLVMLQFAEAALVALLARLTLLALLTLLSLSPLLSTLTVLPLILALAECTIAQLLLPVSDHRIGRLSRFKQTYNVASPLVNENDLTSLGLLGSLGFLEIAVNRGSAAQTLAAGKNSDVKVVFE